MVLMYICLHDLEHVFSMVAGKEIFLMSRPLCVIFRHPDLCLTAVGAKRKLGLQNDEEDVGMIGVHYEVCMRDGGNLPSQTA